MSSIIDLRSDTMTLPSPEMRVDMSVAAVGDDYYGEDPSVNQLEAHCRELFGTEDAVFVASGMMANQLAIAAQTSRGGELITDYGYHVNLFESAQYAAFCQIVLNAWHTRDGILRPEDVDEAIRSKPREPLYAQVQLVSIENTINSRQGKIFPFAEIRALRAFTRERGIRLHLDGARIFNAHVVTGIPLAAYAADVDTLTACFSKGLGAPFGSIVVGSREVLERVRCLRVRYGGGLHQSGVLARAALFALTRQMHELAQDHRRAALLAERVARTTDLGVNPREVETNVVFLDLAGKGWSATVFERMCRERGLKVLVFPPHRIRLMLSRNVSDEETMRAADILTDVCNALDREGKEQQPCLTWVDTARRTT